MSRSIVVDILGNSAGFNNATKEATTSAGKFQNVLQGVGQGIGQAAFGLATAGISAVTSALVDSVAVAREEQLAQVQLTAALEAAIPGWTDASDSIEQYIEAAEKASAFSRDDLRTSLESLVAVTHDVAKAENLQTTATNLARFAHEDLQTATDMLVGVEAGRYRGLASLGIVVKDVKSSQDALNKINAIAAGQDTSYLTTQAGELDALKNSLHDSQAALGDWIDEQTAAAFRGLGKVGDWLSSLAPDAADVAKTKAAVAAGLQAVVDAQAYAKQHLGHDVLTSFKESLDGLPQVVLDAAPITQRALSVLSTDISDGWDALEAQAYRTVTKNGEKFQRAVVGSYVSSVNLSPLIVPDSKRLDTLYAQLAKVEANRSKALQQHDSVSLQADDATIAKLTAEINQLVSAQDQGVNGISKYGGKMAAGGPVKAGVAYTVGEVGAERFVPNMDGTILPHGSGGGTTVNVNIASGSYIDPVAVDKLANLIIRRLRVAPGF